MTETFDALNLAAAPDPRRLMLLQFVRDMEREFCLLCSPGCPLAHRNLFNRLRTALKTTDAADAIEQIIDVEIQEIISGGKRARQIGEAIVSVFEVMSDVWREDALREADK